MIARQGTFEFLDADGCVIASLPGVPDSTGGLRVRLHPSTGVLARTVRLRDKAGRIVHSIEVNNKGADRERN